MPGLVDACVARYAADGGLPRVTGTSLAHYVESPFALWCEVNAPPAERDPPSAFDELLRRTGREHERRQVARLFPGARDAALPDERGAFRATLEAMTEGAAFILQGTLLDLPAGLAGRADVLERRPGASALGDHHYGVVEIKLARNLKRHHALQAMLYNAILGRIQGVTPSHVGLVDRDGARIEVAHDAAALDEAIEGARSILSGAQVPPAILGGGAAPWSSYTDRRAIAARDVSLIPGVGASLRGGLVAAGFACFDDVAAADEARLRTVPGVGPARAARFRVAAGAIRSGTHVVLREVSLPASGTEVFLDLEGTSEQLTDAGVLDVDYLIGALVRDGGGERYVPFVARTPSDEGAMFHAFLAWLATLDASVPIYHWHHYEPTHLKRLGRRHGWVGIEERDVLARMRDLHKEAVAAVAFPTYGTSIKDIAPYVGFRWRHAGVDGMASIALYLQHAADPDGEAAALKKVLDYNEDDCVATRAVKDWLVAAAPPARVA